MDSPEVNMLPAEQMSLCKNVRPDDSGYVTTTPSSGESLELGDSSYYLPEASSTLNLYTPEEGRGSRQSRALYTKPKDLRNSFCSGPSPDPFLPIKEMECLGLPTVLEDEFESPQMSKLKPRSKNLKRQNAVCDNFYNEENKSVTKELNNLAVSEGTQCISSPITPVKNRKKVRKWSSDDSFQDSLTRTPEKVDDNFSPIFKNNLHPDRSKSVKRLFSQQKIGAPEKNQILYPQLKPVTPPKKIKTPEKVGKGIHKTTPSKCSRSLWNKKNYCGREHIDFLKMLGKKGNHLPAVKCILSKLSDNDLDSVCQVCKTWLDVCKADPEANQRRLINARHRERIKENLTAALPPPAKRLDQQHSNLVRRDFMEIQNHSNLMPSKTPAKPRSPPISPAKRQFNKFFKVRSEDSTSQLRKCPRCRMPAKVKGRWAACTGSSCEYSFCTLCSRGHHPGPCTAIEAPSPSKQGPSGYCIGSKQSRRNLRRL